MAKAGVVGPSLRSELHTALAANSQPKPNDAFVELRDFVFGDGENLASLKLHYLTLGTPHRDASGAIANGVLLLHGTAGSAADFATAAFVDALYGVGEPLDLSRHFLVIPDAIGAGDSSKPSDGLHTHFPQYGYKDQVRAQHLLLERIGIGRLKLVLGTSMGGMQTWLWGEMFPNDMDCLVAIASTPAAISGRNMIWREIISQAIRSDPAWKNGDYPKDSPPKNWIKAAIPLSAIMTGSSEQLQKQAPTRETAIDLVDKLEASGAAYDANDLLYAFESSADYDPAPKLNAIIKPMLTINFADDLTNPPEHLHLPTASNYTEVMFPAGPASYGHMTLAHPEVWAPALHSFLHRLPLAPTIQVALAAEDTATAAHAQTLQATSKQAGPPNPLFPDDAEFWYETLRMLGADEYGAGSFGEVLAISRQIKAGDYDSWYDAWNAAGDRLAGEADGQLARGHKVSARDNYLRAANNYRSSEFFLHATPKDPRVVRAYGRQIETYKAAARLFDVPIEPVEIPYEATSLPGYFHRVDQSDRPRPLLIMHTGFDGSAEEMHWSGARAAVARGYNVLAFDGPGQSGPLHREDLPFRPDWEKVVTPVVDHVLKQKGVDPSRIALLGTSMGGELAPRAAAFEPRIAACIANDGLYDFAAAFLGMIPPAQRESFVAQIKAPPGPSPLDAILTGMAKASPVARWLFANGTWAFGATSPREFLRKALDYNLRDGVAEKIGCPTLVCDAEGDLFFKGQADELFNHLTCERTLLRFTEAEGGGAHCQMGAGRLAFARIFDWLDETLGPG